MKSHEQSPSLRLPLIAALAMLLIALQAAPPAWAQKGYFGVEPEQKPPRPPATAPAPALLPSIAPQQNPPPPAPPPAPPRQSAPVPQRTAPQTAQPPAQARTGEGQVTFVALITDDGQQIQQGMVWHVFRQEGPADGRPPKHVTTVRGGNATLKLPAGDYVVTGSFGRAYAARRVKIAAESVTTERLVLNAGGLRLQAVTSNGDPLPPASVSIDIYSDERDQAGNRVLVIGNVKPGVIQRLNSGIYHLVSVYGDANAQVRADVTVEAGKLTEANITHHAGRATLKLVNRAGGEALADTQWSIATPQGIVVKESVGALPTHVLAPGSYTAIARSSGRVFRRDFTLKLGETLQVEVVAQ